MSYWAQSGDKGKVDVVVVMAPLEIVSRYEAPFRTAGMNPGLVTTSSLAALELAPEAGLSVLAKLTGRVLTVVVRDKIQIEAGALPGTAVRRTWKTSRRCWCPPSSTWKTIWGGARRSCCCAASARTRTRRSSRFAEELGVEVEPLRSPLGTPGENNAGLLGYLRSIARNQLK